MNPNHKPAPPNHPWRKAMLDSKKLDEARKAKYHRASPRKYESAKMRDYAVRLGYC